MIFQRSYWIVGLSCIGIILLVLFQVNWLIQSRALIEEQFDQKVTMALCSAVDQLDLDGPSCSKELKRIPAVISHCKPGCALPQPQKDAIERTVNLALERYNIALDYHYDVVDDQEPILPKTYCTPLTSIRQNGELLQVQFSGRDAYVFQQMGFMAVASVLILLFVCSMFLLTLYKFVQQKKLYAQSVAFFNQMAHEFRTPLTNIQLALGVWHRRQPELTDNRFLQIIKNESKTLKEQVERILHIASLKQGNYGLEMEPLALGKHLTALAADFHLRIKESGGQLRVLPQQAESIWIQADPLHLGNVFRNLIDNAIKYAHQPPQIDIEFGQEGDKAYLLFRDNGPGISTADRAKIFAAFERGSQGDSLKEGGFGLGLYYSRQIIELHGGSLSLDKGPVCQFRIELPLDSVHYGA